VQSHAIWGKSSYMLLLPVELRLEVLKYSSAHTQGVISRAQACAEHVWGDGSFMLLLPTEIRQQVIRFSSEETQEVISGAYYCEEVALAYVFVEKARKFYLDFFTQLNRQEEVHRDVMKGIHHKMWNEFNSYHGELKPLPTIKIDLLPEDNLSEVQEWQSTMEEVD